MGSTVLAPAEPGATRLKTYLLHLLDIQDAPNTLTTKGSTDK